MSDRSLSLILAVYSVPFHPASVSDASIRWKPWRTRMMEVLAGLAAGLAIVAAAAAALFSVFRPGNRASPRSDFPAPPPPSGAMRPRRLCLAPEHGVAPLCDDERQSRIDPASLGLSEDLVHRIKDWDRVFQTGSGHADPLACAFADIEAERAWVAQGAALVADLAHEWQGPVINRVSTLERLLLKARQELDPFQDTPPDRTADIAARCGVAEIDDAITRLDALSRAFDAVSDWDGDTRDDIHRAQAHMGNILSGVARRYGECVAAGLSSQQWRTRSHVAVALAGHEPACVLPMLRAALAREDCDLVRQQMRTTLAQLEDPEP